MAALQAPSLSGEEVLGIDAGTQGLSVVLFCPKRSLILGVGESPYEASAIAGLPEGRVEQRAKWWSVATANAMATLRDAIRRDYGGEEIVRVAGIGVTGHMHCLVRKTEGGSKPLGCDMWNDPRGVPESLELSSLFGESIPSRWTGSHILASMRQVPDEWTKVDGVNVTSGSIVHDLTGKWVLGPGDASGMFGQLDKNGQIDRAKLRKLDELVGRDGGKVARPMEEMVPRVIRAGEIAGVLSEAGSTLLGGIPVGTPVAAPEGDQQSVLVGSGIGENELALSAGTSFSGNLLTSTRLKAESEAYNVLHAPDGDTMLMICARNGTVGFARYVESLASLTGSSFQSIADKITERAAALPVDPLPDVVPFWQGENVAELPLAKAEITNAGIDFLSDNPAVMARLLLEGPCMTMRYGIEVLRPKLGNEGLRRVVLSGGALKSKGGYAPQLFADILGVPVCARDGDDEGSAKGAAILAAYMCSVQQKAREDRPERERRESLADFAKKHTRAAGVAQREWLPDAERSAAFDVRYARFAKRVRAIQRSMS